STTFYNSLLPAIRNKRAPSPYSEIYGCYMDLQRMVRTDKYKLIVYPAAKKILLFDMKKDPLEMQDLSGNHKYRKILDDMKGRLVKQQKLIGDDLDLSAML